MKTEQMTLRCEPDFKPSLDDIRKAEPDLPSRTEMLHRLVERAYVKTSAKARRQEILTAGLADGQPAESC